MSEPGSTEKDLALLKQNQDHLEKDLHETLQGQKETNKNLQELTTQIARMCDRFDAINDQLKEVKRITLDNKSRLDINKSTMDIMKGVISAVALGLVGLMYKMLS